MTTTVNTNPANEPLAAGTETEIDPAGANAEAEYVPENSNLPGTEKGEEEIANELARKAAKR
jgi:hypothetical protein